MQKQIDNTALRNILALTLCSTVLFTAGCGSSSSTPAAETPSTFTRQAKLTTAQIEQASALVLPDSAVITGATPGGTASFTLYSTNMVRGSFTLTGFNSPATNVTLAHIHDGVVGTGGGVIVTLEPTDPARLVWTVKPTSKVLQDPNNVAKFKAGSLYVNVHTASNGGGLLRGQLISFADNIQKIFTANCVGCHVAGGSSPMSLVAGSAFGNLVDKPSTSVLVPGGGIRVIPENSANSVLFKKISGTAGPQMPMNNAQLGANDQNLIKVWIDMGAANN